MNEKIRVYIYKYKWLWIANVVLHNWPRTFYYDNNPIEEVRPEKELKYMTVGFTRKSVFKRTKRYVVKNIGGVENANVDL